MNLSPSWKSILHAAVYSQFEVRPYLVSSPPHLSTRLKTSGRVQEDSRLGKEQSCVAITCIFPSSIHSEMQISLKQGVCLIWAEEAHLLFSNAACLLTFLADRIGMCSRLESGDDCCKSLTNTNIKKQLRK